MSKTIYSVYPVRDNIEIIVSGPSDPSKDEILKNESVWGNNKVELQYANTPEELAFKLESVLPPDLIVLDYRSVSSEKRKFKEVLEKLAIGIPTLVIVKNRIPKELNFLSQRDNVFCTTFSTSNKKHLLCSLARIRSYILSIRNNHKEESLRGFIEKLFIWASERERVDFNRDVKELLNKLSSFFGFEVVGAIEEDIEHRFNLYRNEGRAFCPLLLGSNPSRKICEDFMKGEAFYLPIRFIKDENFIFSATDDNIQILLSSLKDVNTCGLCQTFDYKSIILMRFSVGNNNWLLFFCDKDISKLTEETYDGIKSVIPTVSSVISFLKGRSIESKFLDLYNSALASGKIGIWEYEVETRKIVSIGLKSLFPYLSVPNELNEWWQYIHPEDRLTFWNVVKPCLKGLTNSFAVDHRLLLPGDRVVWIRTIGECKEKRDNVATRLIGIGMDITSFMQKERELKDLRENLRVASEMGNIGLWSWDISKNVYSINEPGIRILGMEKKKNYTFEDWLEKISDTFREEVKLEIGRAFSQGQSGVVNIEYQVTDNSGVARWIHTYGRVSEYDSTGNPKVLSGTHIDITTRKMTEKHLMREVVISSRYASLARSLLRVESVEEIAQLVVLANLDITNGEICFAGYTIEENIFHIIGVSKNRERIYEENWKLEELLREFEILEQPLKAGIPLIINYIKGRDLRLFGDKKVERLLFVPSNTPENDIVFVMDVNSTELYSPTEIEAIEWLSSIFAQSYSRMKLEKLNAQKTKDLEETVKQLQSALATVKKLHGLLPICAKCKKIRDDAGYWHEVEVYIRKHSEAEFTHGLCPQCAKELYDELGKMGG